MNGYQLIMNTSIKRLSTILNISLKEAEEIKIMTLSELERCEHICLEAMNVPGMRAKCRDKMYCCRDCRKEFLYDEINGV